MGSAATMETSHVRRLRSRLALVVAVSALVVIAGACAPPPEPPPPSSPTVTAQLSLTDAATSLVGVVDAGAVAKNFPGDGNFDVEWTYRDLTTGSIVHTSTGLGNGDGILFNTLQPGLFEVTSTGSAASIGVEVTATVTRDGATAVGTATRTLTWTEPTSPVSGSIEPTSSYTVADNTFTTCAPVGTEIRVDVSGATSDAYTGFLDLRRLDLADLVPFGSADTVTLTTTEPCWSVLVIRASFLGGISGTMNYTIDWLPAAGPL